MSRAYVWYLSIFSTGKCSAKSPCKMCNFSTPKIQFLHKNKHFYRTQVNLGFDSWVRMSVSETPCVDLTDVTLADEDTNSILTDKVNRTIQGNVAMHATWWPTLETLQGTSPDDQILNQFARNIFIFIRIVIYQHHQFHQNNQNHSIHHIHRRPPSLPKNTDARN